METDNCSATCVPNIDVNITPNPFPLTYDGVTVYITVTKTGECGANYTCTIDNDSGTSNNNDDTIITFTQSDLKNPKTVVLKCTDSTTTITRDISLNGYCAEKTCTTSGTCQALPKNANSLSDCTSTCNSDADCTSGRMIETKP
jgi:hypothetical protein